MGYRQPQMQFIRDPLKFDIQIEDQIARCRDAYNSIDSFRPELVKNAVEMFEKMIYPDIMDDEYKADMLKIQDDFEASKAEAQTKYEKECDEAGCPDVVDPPNIENSIEYQDKKFQAITALCSRLRLLLKKQVDDSI